MTGTKKNRKGLQKLTDEQLNKRIENLISQRYFERGEIPEYLPLIKQGPGVAVMAKLETLSGGKRNDFLKIIIEEFPNALGEETKNRLWESNHAHILSAISTLIQEMGRMPSVAEIGDHTGLSRQTIHKHIAEASNHPLFQGEIDHFRFAATKVLAKVFCHAINGDMKAAKLYLQMMGGNLGSLNPMSAQIQNQQNNFIQINGLTLSQDKIKMMNPEQLSQIETILKSVIPQQS